MKWLPLGAAAILVWSASLLAQQRQTVTTITGHVAKAERLEPTDARAKLVAPAGFEVSTFATGLGKPRVLAVAGDGTVYATRRDTGDVIMLRDPHRSGKAEAPVVVARRPQMHGIALDGTKVYLVTVKELFVAERAADGMLGPLKRLIEQDEPPGGITMEQWDRMSTVPLLLHTAHAAPMQMLFCQGTHAVDTMLALDPGANAAAVLTALKGHVTGRGEIVGLYRAP